MSISVPRGVAPASAALTDVERAASRQVALAVKPRGDLPSAMGR